MSQSSWQCPLVRSRFFSKHSEGCRLRDLGDGGLLAEPGCEGRGAGGREERGVAKLELTKKSSQREQLSVRLDETHQGLGDSPADDL